VGKRVAIILVVILVIGLTIMGYFLQQDRKSLFTDPYKSISPAACIVIESVDLLSFMNSLTTGKGLFGEMGNISEFDSFNRKLKYITDQLNKPGFKTLVNDGGAILSFYATEKGKLEPLLSFTVRSETRNRHIKELLNVSGIMDVSELKSGGSTVFQAPFTVNKISDTAYISLLSGLLVCSTSEELLNGALAQIGRSEDVRSLPGFSRVLLASGKNENKIFIVFSNLKSIFKTLISDETPWIAEKLAELAGTAGGDIYISEDGLVLSGYTESLDSTESLFRYKSLPPRQFNSYKILPSATVLFETMAIHGKANISKSDTGSAPEMIDLAFRLNEFTGTEITRAYIDIKDRPSAENTVLVFELKNSVQAEQIMREEIVKGGEIIYFEPDDQVKIPVYRTNNSGLTGILFPGFATGYADSYFTFHNNFMIAGNSYVTLSKLLYDNILNKTLANDLAYNEFESSLPSRAGYFLYCVPSRITDYLSRFLDKDLVGSLRVNRSSVGKIQAAGLQLASSNGMIYNSISLKFREEAREESTTEWETLLDTVAAIKPFFFTNHNTGAKEIFIQDMRNNTYLINAAGRVLWKVKLRERIAGDIFMVDLFRNGKYQLLFSGRNYIHLLDRNGNYVSKFPFQLRSPATNSLALFDYDNNMNYRLFIAGEDKNIYSYDKNGNTVKGWKPFKTAGFVKEEISYFKVSGKDYIVASDEISLYFLDRTGNTRVTLKEPVTKARGSSIRLTPGSEPSIVCTSPDGTVCHIAFDGSVSKFKLREFSGDHSSDFFDVDGDGFGEYIFIDKGTLYLYDRNRKELFSRDFKTEKLGGPITFVFSATDRKIGLFDVNNKRIFLIDKSGETMNGFPLKGASMFSIGKLSEKSGWHLIVGGTDRFLYNYKLDTGVK